MVAVMSMFPGASMVSAEPSTREIIPSAAICSSATTPAHDRRRASVRDAADRAHDVHDGLRRADPAPSPAPAHGSPCTVAMSAGQSSGC